LGEDGGAGGGAVRPPVPFFIEMLLFFSFFQLTANIKRAIIPTLIIQFIEEELFE
jgi:hypothetical protein